MSEQLKARAWLGRARKIDKEIRLLLDVLEHTREQVTSVTQTLDAVAVSGTKDPHKFDRLAELNNLIDTNVDDLVAIKKEILQAVMKLRDRNQRLVLISYYLDMKTWEQTAVEMNYSYMHIMRIHGYALAAIKDVIECYI